jgi:hypothetical protein
MRPADQPSILLMSRSLGPSSKFGRRARRMRCAGCFLLCAFSIIAFLVFGELAMRSILGFLNQAIEQQFVRASPILVPQIRDEEMHGAPLY